MIGLFGLAGFLIILFMGLPVAFSMMVSGVVGSIFLLHNSSAAVSLLSDAFVSTFTNYAISVAPMFILLGNIAMESGLGSDLFNCAQVTLGHRRGGLANVVQLVCAIFGAICGASVATAAMMSRVAFPEMKRLGYKDTLSTGAIAAGSNLSVLIPPSVPLITYGIIAEESIGKLFIAGIGTGIGLMIFFMITIWIWLKFEPDVAPPATEKPSASVMFKAVRKSGLIEILIVFGISLGGMFAGWFTPTEGGAIGVIGITVVCVIFKRFTFNVLRKSLIETLVLSGMIYCLIAGSTVYGKFFALSRIPTMMGSWVSGLDVTPFIIIFAITMLYLILGCFIDVMPLILLTTPIFYPIVTGIGYSGIWFGCYMIVVCGLGAITPPVGMICYVVSGILKDVQLQTVFRGSMPFLVAFLLFLITLAAVPEIATFLPDLLLQ
jgi:tripartite ATP-independent transporter DctM subunit